MNQILAMPETVSRTHPVRPEASRLMQLVPHISSTALFMKNRLIENGSDGDVAATDSVAVFFWPAFFLRYDKPQRTFILLHEYLHGAYAHPQRGGLMHRRLGDRYSDQVFGIACDGIVNGGIMGDTMLTNSRDISTPPDLVTLAKLHEYAQAVVAFTKRTEIQIDRMREISKLSVETLYAILIELRDAAQEAVDGCEGGGDGKGKGGGSGDRTSERRTGDNDDSPDGQGDGDGDQEEDNAPSDRQPQPKPRTDEEKQRDKVERFLNLLKRPSDLMKEAIGRMTTQELEDLIRGAGDRLRAASHMHGTRPGGLIEALTGDIPTVNTPWESTFRSVTQRYLSRDRVKNHGKPGRRVMTQEAMGSNEIVWHPARKRKPVPHVVVITDSSGSVGAEEYLNYLSEIQAMKKRTQARITSIVADVDVQSVQEIDHIRDLRKIEFKGRGGTDFRPAIEFAQTLDPDLIIYLTDLGGTFPREAPRMPIIWAVCSAYGASNDTVPFGRVININ